MFRLLPLVLFACTTEAPQSKWQPLDQAALPLGAVAYAVPSPASAGRDFELVYTGPQNAPTALLYSNGGLGAGPCPAYLGGECFDITPGTSGINTVMLGRTDATGVLQARLRLPRGVTPDPYVLQLGSQTAPGTFVAAPPFGVEILPYAEDCPNPGASEPNDRAASAHVVTPGVQESGTVCNQDRFDWYAVDLAQGQQLIVDLMFAHVEGDLDVFLLDSPMGNHGATLSATAVASSEGLTDNEFIAYVAPADGTYYVGVGLFVDSGAVGNGYSLDILAL